jgi:hypothetical protein
MKRVAKTKLTLAPTGQRTEKQLELDIPAFLKRGPGNTRPSWLTGPGVYVLSPAKQAEKTRDQEVRDQVAKEIQERRDNRYKARVAKRRATPRDLTGLVWNSMRNRFEVEGQVDIEKAIKRLTDKERVALHNEMAVELKNVAPIKTKDAKKFDLVAACKELWDASQLRRRGLVTNGKAKGKARKVSAPRVPRAPGAAPRAKKEEIKETARIKVLIKPNPHNAKTGGRFAAYNVAAKCKTYGEYLKKGGDKASFFQILRVKSVAIEENGK